MHSWPDPNARWRRTVLQRERPLPDVGTAEVSSPGARFAIAASVLFVVCQATRWGWWTSLSGETRDVGYIGQSVDGLAGAVAAGAMALVIRAKSGASSGFRIVQFLPFALGLGALIFAVSGYEQVYAEMSSHRADGWPSDLDTGVWIALAGGVLAFVGGIRATRARLAAPVHGDVRVVPLRWLGREAAVGVSGALAWLLAWQLAGRIGGSAIGTLGFFVGPIASLGVWHWLRNDGMTEEERRSQAEPVPMDRLHEQGPNR